MSTPELAQTLAAIDRILADAGDADHALRGVVETLHERVGYTWAGIFFAEAGTLELGPEAGDPDPPLRTRVDVMWRDNRVAELAVDGAVPEDRSFLEQVAARVAGHCLVGWDTVGEPWDG